MDDVKLKCPRTGGHFNTHFYLFIKELSATTL